MKMRNLKIKKLNIRENLKNNNLNNKLNKIKIPYSLKNKSTNATLENSVLKPLTNSLSPSDKSKGARFNSQIIDNVKGTKIKNRSFRNRGLNVNLFISKRKHKKKKAKEISYEIDWALARKDPIIPYFDFLKIPARRIV